MTASATPASGPAATPTDRLPIPTRREVLLTLLMAGTTLAVALLINGHG